MGMDKALTEEYPNENTLEQIGKREQGKLFLSDVWGRKCQLLASVPYFPDKLGDAFIPASKLSSAQTNQIYLKFFPLFLFLPGPVM